GGVVAARLIADRDRHAGEIRRLLHLGVRRNENAACLNLVEISRKLAVALGGGDVHGPMAGAGEVGLPAALEGLHRAHLVAKLLRRAVARLHQLAELVVEPLVLEVTLLLSDPFMQAEMRFDDEFLFGHGLSSVVISSN